MNEFLKAYIIAAFWSSDDESTPEGGKPMWNYNEENLAPEALAKMKADCEKFQAENSQDIAGNEEQAGHDFWMTRNRHGVGFWETPDWPKEAGQRLTAAAHKFGEINLVVGDDGLIYCE